MDTIDYELAIVGGGPAGAAAAVYAARKRIKTALITSEWGGQSTVSLDIQNWIGTPSISGEDLAKALRSHVEAYAGDSLTVISPARVESLATFDDHVDITLADGRHIGARALLIGTGANRRKLDIPGAREYDQKGLTYCASCDGPLFEGRDVAVVGGGNAAFETALQLLAYCKSVTLVNRSAALRADEITVAAAESHPHFTLMLNTVPEKVEGDKFVTGLAVRDASGTVTTLPVEGIFVEIGLVPNTAWTGDSVSKNETAHIIIDHKTQRTSHPRVWAAGDCTDALYHQNNIAAGDAIKALEDIYLFLHRHMTADPSGVLALGNVVK
jgi:NADH-dependent peroxiredoxin subunit F